VVEEYVGDHSGLGVLIVDRTHLDPAVGQSAENGLPPIAVSGQEGNHFGAWCSSFGMLFVGKPGFDQVGCLIEFLGHG
jgi:hypothetical protein